MKKLSTIDELYLVKILGLKKTVSKESIYLETGKYPLKYIVIQRRILYFWNLLQRKKTELVSRVMSAQKVKTENNDWYEMVRNDLVFIDMNVEDNFIQNLSKNKLKTILKVKLENKIRHELEQLKKQHSKSVHLRTYSSSPQKYLLSSKLNISEVHIMTNLRTYMLSDAKMNFRGSQKENIWCSVCYLFPESQRHIYE